MKSVFTEWLDVIRSTKKRSAVHNEHTYAAFNIVSIVYNCVCVTGAESNLCALSLLF